MSENDQNPQASEPTGQTENDPWKEVGRQFAFLGESLADAFRTVWEDEQYRRTATEMREGLERLVNDVGKAINEAASTETGKKVVNEAERAAENLHSAGKQAVQDAAPHVSSALRKASAELEKLATRLASRERQEPPAGGEGSGI